MGKVWDFLREHGYALMLGGMILTIAGVLMLFQAQRRGGGLRQAAIAVAAVGVAVYIGGRIGVLFRGSKKRQDQQKKKDDEDHHGDDATDLDSL
jgi:membrane-bound ClpP family serine protease